MTEQEGLTPALSAAQLRRRELRTALVALEDAVSSAAEAEWGERVTARLTDLHQAFEHHVAETEGPGGLYDEMQTLAPHLSDKAQRLREEHPTLATAIDEALARTGRTQPSEIDRERGALQDLMDRLVRHRQRGADLVWGAYMIDIGGGG